MRGYLEFVLCLAVFTLVAEGVRWLVGSTAPLNVELIAIMAFALTHFHRDERKK